MRRCWGRAPAWGAADATDGQQAAGIARLGTRDVRLMPFVLRKHYDPLEDAIRGLGELEIDEVHQLLRLDEMRRGAVLVRGSPAVGMVRPPPWRVNAAWTNGGDADVGIPRLICHSV